METITPEVMAKCSTPVSDDHDEKYGVPSLEELGMFCDHLDIVKHTRITISAREGPLRINC